jgi:hypothetical protein
MVIQNVSTTPALLEHFFNPSPSLLHLLLSFYLSVYFMNASVCLYGYLPARMSTCLPACPACLPVCICTCPSVSTNPLYVCLRALHLLLSFYLCVSLSVYLTVCPYFSFSLCFNIASAYLYVCLSPCLPVCLFACLPVFLSVSHAIMSICLSICLTACLSICLTVCICFSLTVCISQHQTPKLSASFSQLNYF